ncbi:hypothetical protein [Xylocopilactobacillus apicola]|uniref:Uncharacterized protein n=1 Tax=Xylocopilactobacillus apicola TaxID=2932184 RepID=A0AAU9D3D5_9LACO|nr:hypothetical protein [Xylocopilactobacillus apicola]BDR59346.1 hypothetical protein XA3_17870 [Xylocopilactobacillus apicola]
MSIKVQKNETQIHWVEELRQANDLRISWNFSFLFSESKYNFENNELDHRALVKKLVDINKRTLVGFLNLPAASGVEFLDPRKIKGKLANKPVPQEFLKKREDHAGKSFFSIRLSQKSRIIGKRIDNTFYIFGVDLNHELYKG